MRPLPSQYTGPAADRAATCLQRTQSPTDRNRILRASAFFLRSAWPFVAPTRRIFIMANTVTVGATVYRAPAADMAQPGKTL
jgi:hypothetical protein